MFLPRRSSKSAANVRIYEYGQVHVRATFNNTIVTITDMDGNASFVGICRRARLQGLQKVHSVMLLSPLPRLPQRLPSSTVMKSVEVYVKRSRIGT